MFLPSWPADRMLPGMIYSLAGNYDECGLIPHKLPGRLFIIHHFVTYACPDSLHRFQICLDRQSRAVLTAWNATRFTDHRALLCPKHAHTRVGQQLQAVSRAWAPNVTLNRTVQSVDSSTNYARSSSRLPRLAAEYQFCDPLGFWGPRSLCKTPKPSPPPHVHTLSMPQAVGFRLPNIKRFEVLAAALY